MLIMTKMYVFFFCVATNTVFSVFHKGWTLFFVVFVVVSLSALSRKQPEDKAPDACTLLRPMRPVNTVNKTVVQTKPEHTIVSSESVFVY